MGMKKGFSVLILFVGALIAISCSKKSSTTGWKMNEKDNGGFSANLRYKGQETGPV